VRVSKSAVKLYGCAIQARALGDLILFSDHTAGHGDSKPMDDAQTRVHRRPSREELDRWHSSGSLATLRTTKAGHGIEHPPSRLCVS
jgi:hypothetical protein